MSTKLVSFRVEESSLAMLDKESEKRKTTYYKFPRSLVLNRLLSWCEVNLSSEDWRKILSWKIAKCKIEWNDKEDSCP